VNELEVSQKSVEEVCLLSGLARKREATPEPDEKAFKEEEDDVSDELSEKLKEYSGKEASSRSSRGLKVLSVRVRELVFQKKMTTYKEVADELIQELLKEGKMSHDTRNVSM
jgi:hypothetical protein